jgi:flagellar biosynthesis/type III secretory pathway protein FliH
MTTNDSEALSLRLPREDREKLNALVEAKRKELEPIGATISLAQYVRAWIRSSHASMMERQAPAAKTAPAPTPPATATAAAAPAAKTAERTAEEVRQKLAETIEAGAFNQATIGKQTGIDAAMLSRFRKGTGNLGAEKLATLARWLWKISEN